MHLISNSVGSPGISFLFNTKSRSQCDHHLAISKPTSPPRATLTAAEEYKSTERSGCPLQRAHPHYHNFTYRSQQCCQAAFLMD